MQEFFRTNYLVLSFGHGLVFFLLGFAIAITLRHSPSSTLRLARGLKFLAVFGILFGLAEWGATFIPLQRAFLSENTLLVLQLLRLVTMVAAFTALGWFGHSLLASPRPLYRWLRAVPLAAAILWFAGLVLHPVVKGAVDTVTWLNTWEMLARYLMGIPAALVGALAFWTQRPAVARLGFHQSLGSLGAAAAGMVVLAFTEGLFDPRSQIVADMLQRDFLFRTTGIPLEVIRVTAGLALTVSAILATEALAYETRRRLDDTERQRAVLEERHRIGQELQDGVIQRIYAATLYVECADSLVGDDPGQAQENLQSAMTQMDDTIRFIRDHLVADGGLPLEMPVNLRPAGRNPGPAGGSQ